MANLNHLMQQTRTIFSGDINKQLIQDIPCEAVIMKSEKSEPMEVPKETELNENTDDCVNEEVTESLSQEEEK